VALGMRAISVSKSNLWLGGNEVGTFLVKNNLRISMKPAARAGACPIISHDHTLVRPAFPR
jgi:hypothetical protein